MSTRVDNVQTINLDWGYEAHGLDIPTLEQVLQTPVQEFIEPRDRLEFPSLGRVHFFVAKLQANEAVDPIDVDSMSSTLVIDGVHRLLAHRVLGIPKIRIHFSGWVDDLKRLKKRTRVDPTTVIP
jgi:hypothetical protein